MYGQSLYPRVGQPGHGVTPPAARSSSHHYPNSSPSTSSEVGIAVAIKPEYRITHPPQLSPQLAEIPRSIYHFDFDFERKLLAEAEKDGRCWSKLALENLSSKATDSPSLSGTGADQMASKYIACGLNREAVLLAVAHFGDNPNKIQEFAKGFTLLREMGFPSSKVAEALTTYDNDTEKAIAHFLNGSS